MFVGKAGAYPIEEPFRYSTLGYAPGLAHKQSTRLEKLVRGKHFSLSRKFLNYGQKSFKTFPPEVNVIKLFACCFKFSY
jgi:hypothetical protein